MLEIENLSAVYSDGTNALNNFSLKVSKNENVALIGANGAGKTSLMLALTGILPILSGNVNVDGVTLNKKNINLIREKIGLVFQNPDDQLFMPTVFDDAAFGPRNMGLDEDEAKKRANWALEVLGISKLCNRSPLKLSGGEKRLAAVAAVISMRPSLLLFDEPTAFLDLKARRNFQNILKSMPHTKIIASHELPFLLDVCDRVVVIKKGAVFADGNVHEIINNSQLMEDADM